ncbi:MAG TPA: glycosyltransferase [Solirubrobacterales bacterium]|jgi:GT2 family glycosyltransferase|nr:glycosyltransferase [Solirubrobacterales bacterium]
MAEPRFSILTPIYETPPDVLGAMLRSVRRQTFDDWELCLVDDCSPSPYIAEVLAREAARDPRIRVRTRDENGGIVAASNDALTMARGEFLALLDHDDLLHPEALALTDAALRADPEIDYLYTDEDKLDAAGHHAAPFFKPDWSPERFRTQMYTCHLSVLRRSLVEEVGGFDPEFEGSQDWDLVLKVTERARKVHHIPRVLYHWRMLESSAAGGGVEAKPWAYDAGTRAIKAHCERTGVPAEVIRDEDWPGVYHLEPRLREKPLVSIVIPTAGTRREVRYEDVVLVEHCVRSIVETSTYEDYEIVVVIDHHADPGLAPRLEEIAGERLRVVRFEKPFNFSEKINTGVVHSDGEYLLLLNDDMEVVTPDWIERLVMYAAIPEVGAVGGRLIWEDGRLQHVGVLFENVGYPGHPYRGFSGGYNGYSNNVLVAQNYLAVTAACMMTRRDLFEAAGGFSSEFPMNYNDMDYCLKLRADGLRVVYDPDTILYHFESSSRATDVEDWEKDQLRARWLPMTANDPFSNPQMKYGVPRLSSPFAWMRRKPRLRH